MTDPLVDDWVRVAWEQLDEIDLLDAAAGLVNIPSPTGSEVAIADHLRAAMADAGLTASTQQFSQGQANAVGRLRGRGDGRSLLLYAPIDTLLDHTADDNSPGVGPVVRRDMEPHALISGDRLQGLAAGNPKGHAACVLAAGVALAKADLPLAGDLLLGFGAGGMPTNPSVVDRSDRSRHIGHGVGCSYMLEQGVYPDAAVIAKPGPTVEYEEVGLCWFRVEVKGTHSYVGSRHRIDYRSAITAAGCVAQELEQWFAEYSRANASGMVEPQGIVGAVHGGWSYRPSFTPESCVLSIDLRISPRVSPRAAHRQLSRALREIATRHRIDADLEMVLSIPGTSTSPDHWIVNAATNAWEAVHGRPHQFTTGTSGATDANILRSRGVPTARIGMPKPLPLNGDLPLDFEMGMNTVDGAAMRALARSLIHCAVHVCAGAIEETGA